MHLIHPQNETVCQNLRNSSLHLQPYYPQANHQAKRTVHTIKNLLQNAKDPYMALLSCRATPMQWCNLSPAELLQGCRIRTDVPSQETLLFLSGLTPTSSKNFMKNTNLVRVNITTSDTMFVLFLH